MRYLLITSLFALLFLCSCNEEYIVTEDTSEPEQLVKSGEKDSMILLTDRPQNLETPLHYFLQDFTPNKVFFVRWHLSGFPKEINKDSFRLNVSGSVEKNLSLSLYDLRKNFTPNTINALALCAGNSRSFFSPRVPGAQWKNGGMGNARWTGVLLRDILAKAGINKNSVDVSFNGMDKPPMDSVPDFEKSLSVEFCLEHDVLIAYEMNGEPLPYLNGYPLKLIVPGWYATYWVGMLNDISVHDKKYKGYWMDKAYKIPKGVRNGDEAQDKQAKETEPLSKIAIRSIFVTPTQGEVLELHRKYELNGLAFDGGDGIKKVEISIDNGATWKPARLQKDLGKYSWRRWLFSWTPDKKGEYTFLCKATNTIGETQPLHQWNRSGYLRNEIEKLTLRVK